MANNLEFFQDSDNYEDIVLLNGDSVIDSVAITNIKVDVGGILIDSNIDAAAFTFPVPLEYNGTTVNGVRMNLSIPNTLVEYNKAIKTQIVIISNEYPNGIVWDNNVLTTVRRAPQ